ncbi:MAG: hypothetical protein ACKOCH_10310, partial [Bacteroidota bacterium]
LRQKLPRIPDTVLASEIRRNIATAAFNAGIPAFLKAENLRKNLPGFNPDTSLIQHSACRWFALSRQADTSYMYAREGERWCAQPRTLTRYPCCRVTRENTFLLNKDPLQSELPDID